MEERKLQSAIAPVADECQKAKRATARAAQRAQNQEEGRKLQEANRSRQAG